MSTGGLLDNLIQVALVFLGGTCLAFEMYVIRELLYVVFAQGQTQV